MKRQAKLRPALKIIVWKRCYLQDAGVHRVHETSCREWSHDKKVSQHSAYSLLCHLLRADWTGVEKTKTALGPMTNSSKPCVQTESNPGRVKLSVLDVTVLLTDGQSLYRGSVSTSQMLESISTSSAPPRPAQLLVHWHNKCALRQAGEHSFLPGINRKRVHSFLPVINRKREHSFPL